METTVPFMTWHQDVTHLPLIHLPFCCILFMQNTSHEVQPVFEGRDVSFHLLKREMSKNLQSYLKTTTGHQN